MWKFQGANSMSKIMERVGVSGTLMKVELTLYGKKVKQGIQRSQILRKFLLWRNQKGPFKMQDGWWGDKNKS